MYDIITIGGATKDISFSVSEGVLINNRRDLLRQELLAFERGSKIRVDRFNHLCGGGAANAAVNFAKSGLKSAIIANLGQDQEAKEIIVNFRHHKVATSLLSSDHRAQTGFSFILLEEKSGERIIFTNRCANDRLSLSKSAQKALTVSKWVYVSSLGGSWEKIMKIVTKTKKQSLAWNPGALQYGEGSEKIIPFLKKTDIFFLNRDEATELVLNYPAYHRQGRRFFSRVENLLAAIKSFGPQIVVITSGAAGADAFDGKNFYHQDIVKNQKRVDTTGVGDSFNSAVVIGLSLGANLQQSLHLGAISASSKVSHLGAQGGLIDLRPELKKILKK